MHILSKKINFDSNSQKFVPIGQVDQNIGL